MGFPNGMRIGQTITVNGVLYIAVKQQDDSCKGCDMRDKCDSCYTSPWNTILKESK